MWQTKELGTQILVWRKGKEAAPLRQPQESKEVRGKWAARGEEDGADVWQINGLAEFVLRVKYGRDAGRPANSEPRNTKRE